MDGLNLYQYVSGNPVRLNDPSGMNDANTIEGIADIAANASQVEFIDFDDDIVIGDSSSSSGGNSSAGGSSGPTVTDYSSDVGAPASGGGGGTSKPKPRSSPQPAGGDTGTFTSKDLEIPSEYDKAHERALDLKREISSAIEEGDYHLAAAGAALYGLNAGILAPLGLAYDSTLGYAWNAGNKAAGGLAEGDYDRALEGSIELGTLGVFGKLQQIQQAIPGAPKGFKGLTPKGKAPSGFGPLSKAAEYGLKTYSQLAKALKGTGLQAHHLIEKRFAATLGVKPGQMTSVAVTKAEHKLFTQAWRQAIPYKNAKSTLNTATATDEQIMNAARMIYKDYPKIMEALGL